MRKFKVSDYLPAILVFCALGLKCLSYLHTETYPWLTRELAILLGLPRSPLLVEALEARGRMLYDFLVTLYLIAFCFAFGMGAHVIARSRGGGSWINRRVLGFAGAALLAGVLFSLFQRAPFNGTCSSLDHDIWSQLVCSTVGKNTSAFGLKMAELHLWLDALGISMAAFLALAACTVLSSQAGPEGQTVHLKQQMRHLSLILTVGSVFLIIAVLRVSTILHLSLEYLQVPPSIDMKPSQYVFKSIEDLVSVVLTGLGSSYTILLSLLYLPAALLLNSRSRSEEIALPIAEQLLRLAAILGPLLVGPVGKVLGDLK